MPNFIDLTGREYGRYTVLGRVPVADLTDRPRTVGAVWRCLCDPERGGCGAVRELKGAVLRAGKATRCKSCKIKAVHRTSAAMKLHVAALSTPTFARVCRACGVEFTGTARQKYCRAEHRPSRAPKVSGS